MLHLSIFFFFFLTNQPILSAIHLRLPILSMPLLTKYHNPRPVAEGGGQSSPVWDLTPAWPFVMRFTARTKESQWSLVTGFRAIRLSQHVSRGVGGGVDRGKVFPGQGSAKMPHARSSVTWTSAILDDSRACAPLHLGKGAISSPLMGVWLSQ